MECSQAVLMLMLLVPCEQSGGMSPETVIAEQREAAPVVRVAPVYEQLRASEAVLPATADAKESTKAATPGLVEPGERNPSGANRVSEQM